MLAGEAHHAGAGVLSFWYGLPAANTTHDPSAVAEREWKPVGVGDFNGDSTKDVVWFNPTTRQVAIWFMAPNGEKVSDILLSDQPDEGWQPMVVQDADGNGTLDIIWQNVSTRVVSAWLMEDTEVKAMRNYDFIPDPEWTLVP